MANLKERYQNEVVAQLKEQFSYANVMQVPRITKVTLNMGIGEAVSDKKLIDNAIGDLEKLSGQKPLVTKARKSIAGFQGARRLADRYQSNTALRAYVGLPGPSGEHCDSSRA
ncbi:hypothetical protein HAALTHF_06200n [Vreelandella aquamarina]|nr:hypothetical protein HAALTHF_06200n [Halomonas axialensis]